MHPKGQMAIEYLTTYAYVFIAIIIVISALLLFITYPKTVLPTQCSVYSGFSCIDATLTQNTVGGSDFAMLVSDEQIGITNVSSFNVSIGGVNSIYGSCVPQRISSGQTTLCSAHLPLKINGQAVFTGTFDIRASYCVSTQGNATPISCPATGNFTYSGGFRTQGITKETSSTTTISAPAGTTSTILFDSNAIATTTQATISLQSIDTLSICGAGAEYQLQNWTWSVDVNDTYNNAFLGGSNIGHNSTQPTPSKPDPCTANVPAGRGIALSGVGLVQPDTYTLYTNHSTAAGVGNFLVYNVLTANSFVVIMIGTEDAYPVVVIPSSCTSHGQEHGADSSGFTEAATCVNQAAGSYNVSADTSFYSDRGISLAAYVFPPQYIVPPSSPQYTTANVLSGTDNNNQIASDLLMHGGYDDYICAGATSNSNGPLSPGINSESYTPVVQDTKSASAVGSQSSQTCSINGWSELAQAGIALYGEPTPSVTSSYNDGTGSVSVSYTVSSPNSFVVIIGACGYNDCTSLSNPTPADCAIKQNVITGDTFASAFLEVCQSQPNGPYSVTATESATGGGATIAAYVFPGFNPIGV